jgi:hypothetical protein
MLEELFAGYSADRRPLAAYAALMAVFNGLLAATLLLLRRSGRQLPERIAPGDVLLLGVAAHKLSRVITRDRVTSPLRAPFAEYQGAASGSEVNERPRGQGARLAVGELLTCPYCVSQWVAALLGVGLLRWPRLTRFVAAVFSVTALADLLHRASEAIEHRAT